MYSRIIVPVDLAHAETLTRGLEAAAALARLWSAEVVYAGVTAETPTPLGHNPEEYRKRLEAFAARQGELHGVKASAHACVSTDPAVDTDSVLLRAIEETGADLVVMASHVPTFADVFWSSHGGNIARRAGVSVFLVR